jgi:hypothetical protein
MVALGLGPAPVVRRTGPAGKSLCPNDPPIISSLRKPASGFGAGGAILAVFGSR